MIESSEDLPNALNTAQKVPHKALDLFIKKDFMPPEDCADVIQLVDAELRPSQVNNDLGDALFRTSQTCDLRKSDPIVAATTQKIAAFLGLAPSLAEPLQGQRYEIGQEFKAHTDYFEPNTADFKEFCGQTGQRTWTAMVYLNDVEAGGATRFKKINKTIKPESGKLVCWSNLTPEGVENFATLHHAMKVRKGRKYVITQWFRQRPWV